jgi:NADPH:quinone reductase-like Zn-dependent oxidoreductase
MSQAVFTDALGGIEHIRVGQYEPGLPQAGEVLLRQRVMGVNYSDVLMRRGGYGAKPPFILGREGVGVVESLGLGVNDFKVGDRVAYTATTAALRERAQSTFAAYRAGHFKLEHITQFSLDRAADAHRAIESRNTIGPIVLTA